MSQREFAAELGVSASAVAQWETGARKTPPSIARVVALYAEQSTVPRRSEPAAALFPTRWWPRTVSAGTAGLVWYVLKAAFGDAAHGSLGERLRTKALREYVARLRALKGLHHKFGQMLSYLQVVGNERDRRIIAEVLRSGPAMPASAVARTIRRELGDAPTRVFARWNMQPIAVASLGQVHRATTHGGATVAVKIQFAAVVDALRSDLRNVEVLDRLYTRIHRAQRPNVVFATLREHFLQECDYGLEADHLAMFGAMFAGRDDIVIPVVHPQSSTQRVLTMSFEDGMPLAGFAAGHDIAARERAAKTLSDFFYTSALRHGIYNTDPNPDNFRFRDDAVVFLDFGRTQRLSTAFVVHWKRLIRATLERDRAGAFEAGVSLGNYERNARFDRDYGFRLMLMFFRHALQDEFEFTSAHVARTWQMAFADNVNRFDTNYTPDMVFLNQFWFGVNSILAALGVRVGYRASLLDLLYEPNEARPPPYSDLELQALGVQ